MSNFEQEWAKRYNTIQDKNISKMITFPSKKTVRSFGSGTGLNMRPYQEQYSTSLQPMIERQKEEAEALARQIRPQMPYNNIIENTGKILYENLPPYPFGYSLGMLVQAKRDMDKANLINSDNYYHRLGMAQIGQEANNIPGLYPAGKFWGYAKEGLDITKKVLEGQPFLEILKDSQKDLNNNDESLNWGLNNPNASVRKWLGGLDINTNTWKKQNE